MSTPGIVIHVENGIVQQVYTNTEMDVSIVDKDSDCSFEEDVIYTTHERHDPSYGPGFKGEKEIIDELITY